MPKHLLILFSVICFMTIWTADARAGVDTGAIDTALPLHGLDEDDDSWPDSVDCAPSDPEIFPGAEEICDDGLDNDCDGRVDTEEEECSAVPCGCSTSPAGGAFALWVVLVGLKRRQHFPLPQGPSPDAK